MRGVFGVARGRFLARRAFSSMFGPPIEQKTKFGVFFDDVCPAIPREKPKVFRALSPAGIHNFSFCFNGDPHDTPYFTMLFTTFQFYMFQTKLNKNHENTSRKDA